MINAAQVIKHIMKYWQVDFKVEVFPSRRDAVAQWIYRRVQSWRTVRPPYGGYPEAAGSNPARTTREF